jgi:putative mRNA 3-end processing factor
MALLELAERGLYCASGDFYIDPWAYVDRAVITHAHAVLARPGASSYLTAASGQQLLRASLGMEAEIQTVAYGESLTIGRARVSLHPAGHMLGSAQVRIESSGEVWVVSGDYKLASDATCAPFETVRCHTFVTEASFGLPVFRWPSTSEVIEAIHSWWRANQEADRASLLYTHPQGKAQRLLALLDASIGPIYTHPAVEGNAGIYRAEGIGLAPTIPLDGRRPWSRALVMAPLSEHGTDWEKRFGVASTAYVSGWMRVRGIRRRRSLDRGFVLSDHADWPGLLRAIEESRAEHVWVTHGYRGPMVRWLQEHGRDAVAVETRFEEDER